MSDRLDISDRLRASDLVLMEALAEALGSSDPASVASQVMTEFTYVQKSTETAKRVVGRIRELSTDVGERDE